MENTVITTRPTIFISYSWDSDEHKKRGFDFSQTLRDGGLETRLDQHQEVEQPPEGWPQWMANQIDDADFVLMVCTESYHRRATSKELALVQFFYTDPLEKAGKLSRFHHGLQSGEILLKYIVDSSLLAKPDQRLLLVIAQFEELYTLNPLAVQTAFVERLLELIPLTPPTTLTSTVVLTLRADFMNQAPFAQALNAYPSQMLGPMTVAELRTVIEPPLSKEWL